MSLPAAWIDRIFEKLATVYGRDFLSRWEGLDINAVKSDWGHELSGFFTHPDSISFVLANLPPKPPSVVDFKHIARQYRAPDVPRIEAKVKADPALVAEVLQRLVNRARTKKSPKQWAWDLIARHERGDKRAPACVEMARCVTEGRGLPLGEWSES